MSIRQQTFAGVRWTTASSFGRIGLQLVQVMVLARLLAPADFGVVATVIAVLAVLQVFADGGVSSAIVHFQDMTRDEADSLYWLNVIVSSIVALAIAAVSRPLARWYEQPPLASLLLIAAATLIVTAFGQQLRVMAQKRLRFPELARVDLGGALAGSVVAVTAATLGAGAHSLLLGTLVTATATTALAWAVLSDGWRPAWRLDWRDVRRVAPFGAYTVGNNLVNTLNSQADVLIGSRLLGAQAIGLYSVPKDLSLRLAAAINPIVTEVSFPVMAGAQRDRALLRRLYLGVIRMTASVTFPGYALLAVFAPEVVQVLLGDAWAAAVPLLRILACWALVRSTANPIGSLVMAVGRPDLSFVWNVALLALLPPAVFAGSLYGLEGMALAMALLAAFLFLPGWYFLVRPLCGAGVGEYTRQVAVPLATSGIAAVAGYAAAMPLSGALPRLVVGGVAGAAVYLGASWYLNRPWCLAILELLGRRLPPASSPAGP